MEYNIVSHIDYDGLISAFLITRVFGMPKSITFTVPQMIKEGKIKVTENTIVCDLPNPKEKTKLWFDHHKTGTEINTAYKGKFDPNAKSCAQVIFEEYKLQDYEEMVKGADKIDSASFTERDFKVPDAAGRISMCMATGHRYRDDLFKLWVIELLNRGIPIEEIAESNIVKETLRFKTMSIDDIYEGIEVEYVQKANTKIGVIDKAGVPKTVIYRLFLDNKDLDYVISYSVNELDDQFYNVGIGANPFDKKRNKLNMAAIAKGYGGGGHNDVCGFKVKRADWEDVKRNVIKLLGEASAQ